MDNPILIHAEQIGKTAFGDPRLVKVVLLAVADRAAICHTQLEGRTQKQQNPYPPATLPWATWLIARLGGWSAYRSQRPPGMPTFILGLQQFEAIFIGWKTALAGLVCTP